jgi:hypothetical protein
LSFFVHVCDFMWLGRSDGFGRKRTRQRGIYADVFKMDIEHIRNERKGVEVDKSSGVHLIVDEL